MCNLYSIKKFSAFVVVLVLLSATARADSLSGHLRGSVQWFYEGDVRPRPTAAICVDKPCDRYCELGICAHGAGHLGVESGWIYDGSFVGGMMEGSGRFENDFYVYVGGFKANEFDGDGAITCIEGPRYEGHFTEGVLTAKFEMSSLPVDTRIVPGDKVDWVGPCD